MNLKRIKNVAVATTICLTLANPLSAFAQNFSPDNPYNIDNGIGDTRYVRGDDFYKYFKPLCKVVFKMYDEDVPSDRTPYYEKTIWRNTEGTPYTGNAEVDKIIDDDLIKDDISSIYYGYGTERIISINGVPIENTEYAEFSGKIDHMERLRELQKPRYERKVHSDSPQVFINKIQEALGYEKTNMSEDEIIEVYQEIVEASKKGEDIKTVFEKNKIPKEKDLSVEVNGIKVYTDVQPYIKDGRTMIPFRAIFEALGAKVNYNFSDPQLRLVWADKGDTKVEMKIGDKKAMKNGNFVEMDIAPEIRENRTFIPVRYASELLGAKVDWDSENKKVIITME